MKTFSESIDRKVKVVDYDFVTNAILSLFVVRGNTNSITIKITNDANNFSLVGTILSIVTATTNFCIIGDSSNNNNAI